MRSLEEITKDIEYWRELSAACPHCPHGCYCDGGWGPESRLESLYQELEICVSG